MIPFGVGAFRGVGSSGLEDGDIAVLIGGTWWSLSCDFAGGVRRLAGRFAKVEICENIGSPLKFLV